MGLEYTIREAIRRTLRMPYIYNGVAVKDAATLRVLRGLAARGRVWTNGNEVFFRNEFGVFAVPVEDVNLLRVFTEDLKSEYGYLDVKDKVVADIGAYLGETAVMFARMGRGGFTPTSRCIINMSCATLSSTTSPTLRCIPTACGRRRVYSI